MLKVQQISYMTTPLAPVFNTNFHIRIQSQEPADSSLNPIRIDGLCFQSSKNIFMLEKESKRMDDKNHLE